MDDRTRRVVRAIFGLKAQPPSGSQRYRSGWDDGLEAAMDAAKNAEPEHAPSDNRRPPEPERGSGDAAELRDRLFGYVQAGAEEEDLPSFAAALDEYVAAQTLNSAERTMLRFALGQAEERMESRSDEFTAADRAAFDSLKRLAGDGEP
jgi:hypothetical protein